ncbi:Ku protein [Streptomyces sp. NPDC050856]|uniref:non-homologous end joining protein Ku n=1 Tax=Streptomyces sp. NPDC050856 TaxID=3154939 RepID=UPI0033C37DF8
MPRPVWSGAISFGLVTIPIKVVPAVESHAVSFHQIHLEDQGRIRYQKVCTLDDKVLDQSEIGKGYEVSKDTIIEITDQDLDGMPLPTAKAIEIVAFVPAESVDPVRLADTSYYLAADGQVAAKPYKLLQKALERSSKVAVAKFAWHGRERLGLLRVKEGAIVLHSMKWPDEIRDPAELAPRQVEVDQSEIDGAVALIEAMTTEDLEQYHDEYRKALQDLIEAKAQGHRPEQPEPAAEPGGQVVDLMAALSASVEQAKKSRGETGEDTEHVTVHDLPERARAAKKTAKKTTAKKASARKPRKAG